MRKLSGIIIACLLVGLVVFSAGSLAKAKGGVNPVQLMSAGWACFNPVPGVVSCFAPPMWEKMQNYEGPLTGLTFSVQVQPGEPPEFTFRRTAIMLTEEQYHGQPCGPEGLDEWHEWPTPWGLYYLCHHGD